MAALAKAIRRLEDALLNPIITGPLLLILTRGPDPIREPLRRQLGVLLSEANIARLLTGLKWVVALGIVRKLNRWLNSIALNNWQIWSSSSKWIWNQEVAVVTGGSSGIGAEIVKALKRKGVKVAVLDIQPLPKALDGCKLHFESGDFAAANSLLCRPYHQVLPMRRDLARLNPSSSTGCS